jgi:hypothetical protein
MRGLDPGLLNSLAALKKFLPGLFISSCTISTAFYGLSESSNPAKKGCLRAWAGVILFCGSKIIILSIRSIACALALGINYCKEVGTNLGKVNPILAASW